MKFKIKIKGQTGDPWEEDYDTEDLMDPDFDNVRGRQRCSIPNPTQESIEEYGRDLIKWFNASLRDGESLREFISARFVEDAS